MSLLTQHNFRCLLLHFATRSTAPMGHGMTFALGFAALIALVFGRVQSRTDTERSCILLLTCHMCTLGFINTRSVMSPTVVLENHNCSYSLKLLEVNAEKAKDVFTSGH
jgi:hypothetical protein